MIPLLLDLIEYAVPRALLLLLAVVLFCAILQGHARSRRRYEARRVSPLGSVPPGRTIARVEYMRRVEAERRKGRTG